MTRAVVAADRPRGPALAAGLEREGVEVFAVLSSTAVSDAVDDVGSRAESDAALAALQAADVLVLEAHDHSLTARVVAACDRLGVRIVALATPADARLAASFGLAAVLGADAPIEAVADAVDGRTVELVAPLVGDGGSVLTVWGPPGSPGRTTVAIELAMELARGARRVCLADADTHAPSIALALGIPDEGPGFAAACRQAERDELDGAELGRIAQRLAGTDVHVLAGINRPSRWPELSEVRVTAALERCRAWADYTVVDVAAPLERDEEIVSDLEGPRRNAATLAALRASDLVVATVGADPVGVARFVRGFSELRAAIGTTPVVVVANRVRTSALGIDPRGQLRRTLERFSGIRDVSFLPSDPRSVDAALLASAPIARTAPRSSLTLAVRRLAGDAIVPRLGAPAAVASPRRRGERIRRRNGGRVRL